MIDARNKYSSQNFISIFISSLINAFHYYQTRWP